MRRHGCATGPTPKTRGRARRWRRSRSAPISLGSCASCSRSVCSRRRGRSPEGSSTPGVRAIRSSRSCTCAIRPMLRTACSWIRTRWMRRGWSRSTGTTPRPTRDTSRMASLAAATSSRRCTCSTRARGAISWTGSRTPSARASPGPTMASTTRSIRRPARCRPATRTTTPARRFTGSVTIRRTTRSFSARAVRRKTSSSSRPLPMAAGRSSRRGRAGRGRISTSSTALIPSAGWSR